MIGACHILYCFKLTILKHKETEECSMTHCWEERNSAFQQITGIFCHSPVFHNHSKPELLQYPPTALVHGTERTEQSEQTAHTHNQQK